MFKMGKVEQKNQKEGVVCNANTIEKEHQQRKTKHPRGKTDQIPRIGQALHSERLYLERNATERREKERKQAGNKRASQKWRKVRSTLCQLQPTWAAQQSGSRRHKEPGGVIAAETAQSSSTLAQVLGISNKGMVFRQVVNPAAEAALNDIHMKEKALAEGSVSQIVLQECP